MKNHEKLGLHQVLKYFFVLQEILCFIFTSQCSSMQGIQSIGKNIITWSIWIHFNLSFLYTVCSWFITAHKLIVQIKSDPTKTTYSIAKCIYSKLISAPLWNLYICHIYFEPDSNNRLAQFGREISTKTQERCICQQFGSCISHETSFILHVWVKYLTIFDVTVWTPQQRFQANSSVF